MGQINQTEFRVNREHFVVEHFSVPSNPSCFEEAYHKIFLNFFSNSKIKVRTETFRIISRRAINRIFKSRER